MGEGVNLRSSSDDMDDWDSWNCEPIGDADADALESVSMWICDPLILCRYARRPLLDDAVLTGAGGRGQSFSVCMVRDLGSLEGMLMNLAGDGPCSC